MHKQKNNKTAAGDGADSEVEKRIDDLMYLKSGETLGVNDASGKTAEPPLDAAVSPSTAPSLPKDLAESIAADTPATSEAVNHKELASKTKIDAADQADADSDETEAAKAEPAGNHTGNEAPAEKAAAPDAAVVADAKKPNDFMPDDKQIDSLVDDIVRHESDEVLEAEDIKRDFLAPPAARGFGQKLQAFFAAWWRRRLYRYGTLLFILAVLVGLAIWPASRYAFLNTAGVRSAVSLKVSDDTTQLPLKNVLVTVGGASGKTDERGLVHINSVRLGRQELKIERVAFAPVKKTLVIGWGSNPLGNFRLKAVGAQYVFLLRDWLSGKQLDMGSADSGQASAVADKNGRITLTVKDPGSHNFSVRLTAKGYRSEKLSVAPQTQSLQTVQMVPERPVIYVSKQSGRYDLFRVDADGKNKKLLLAGTGNESSNISLLTSSDGKKVAYVSTRDDKRDSGGYLLSTLTVIDLDNEAQPTAVDHAQRIRLIDWSGSRLIYVAAYAAPSAATSQRNKLISYDAEEANRSQLVTSDNLHGIIVASGYIYYATSTTDPSSPAVFARIKLDGSGKQVIMNRETWTVIRTGFSALAFETPDGWYKYSLENAAPASKDGSPPEFINRFYAINPYKTSQSVWVEDRDGKGTLLLHNQPAGKDSAVEARGGLNYPLVWLNATTVQYRVSSNGEVAEYVKSLEGGDARKVTDATLTYGVSQEY